MSLRKKIACSMFDARPPKISDVQETAVSIDSDLATLLRKGKIFSVWLENAEFKQWVDQCVIIF
jgi:hypothetical protein